MFSTFDSVGERRQPRLCCQCNFTTTKTQAPCAVKSNREGTKDNKTRRNGPVHGCYNVLATWRRSGCMILTTYLHYHLYLQAKSEPSLMLATYLHHHLFRSKAWALRPLPTMSLGTTSSLLSTKLVVSHSQFITLDFRVAKAHCFHIVENMKVLLMDISLDVEVLTAWIKSKTPGSCNVANRQNALVKEIKTKAFEHHPHLWEDLARHIGEIEAQKGHRFLNIWWGLSLDLESSRPGRSKQLGPGKQRLY